MSSWKETNVNVGFLVAIVVGVVAMAGVIEGFRHWIDARFGVAAAPVVARVEAVEARLEAFEARLDSDDRRRNQQYGQLRQDICLLARSVGGECAAGVSPSGYTE